MKNQKKNKKQKTENVLIIVNKINHAKESQTKEIVQSLNKIKGGIKPQISNKIKKENFVFFFCL